MTPDLLPPQHPLPSSCAKLELETETHSELERQLRTTTRPADVARLRSNIKASEERKDELNIRAFKCVSALAVCDDMEERV